ncbi:MAG TPA: hypothetical protein VE174_06655 [Actinomycetota bacterium]|nr:hypothetical protein [Actinomycetota bacterium]
MAKNRQVLIEDFVAIFDRADGAVRVSVHLSKKRAEETAFYFSDLLSVGEHDYRASFHSEAQGAPELLGDWRRPDTSGDKNNVVVAKLIGSRHVFRLQANELKVLRRGWGGEVIGDEANQPAHSGLLVLN